MRRIILPVILFLSLIACNKQELKKQSQAALQTSQANTLVNTWLDSIKSEGAERKKRMDEIKSNLDYDQLSAEKLTDEETLILIPLKKWFKSNVNKEKNPDNYLLLFKGRDGAISKGNLVQYIPLLSKAGLNLTADTFVKILSGQKLMLNGSVSFLTIYDRFFTELKYENGVKKALSTMVSAKPPARSLNRAPVVYCVEWYWVTTTYYPNGTTTTEEEYLYTVCYSNCQRNEICAVKDTDNLGGGSACDDVESEMAGSPVSIKQSVGGTSATGTTRTKAYSWEFYAQNQGMWSFSSHEVGVHKKVGSAWQWQSLTHKSFSKSGMWVGIVINCILNTAIPQVGIYHAGMQLNYNIVMSFLYPGCPLSAEATFTSNSPIWNVND